MKKLLLLVPLLALVMFTLHARRRRQAEQPQEQKQKSPYAEYEAMKAKMLEEGGVIVKEEEKSHVFRFASPADEKEPVQEVNTVAEMEEPQEDME